MREGSGEEGRRYRDCGNEQQRQQSTGEKRRDAEPRRYIQERTGCAGTLAQGQRHRGTRPVRSNGSAAARTGEGHRGKDAAAESALLNNH